MEALHPRDETARAVLDLSPRIQDKMVSVTSVELLAIQATMLQETAHRCWRASRIGDEKGRFSAMRHMFKAIAMSAALFKLTAKVTQGSGNAPPVVRLTVGEGIDYVRDENGDIVVMPAP